MKTTMTRLALAALASGAVAAAASAATPAEGTISNSSPQVGWTGTLRSSGTYYNSWAQDPSIPCQNPPSGATVCDGFGLKIGDAGSALITVNLQNAALQGNNGSAGIRVEKPDGSYVYVQGESGKDVPLELDLADAAKGDYMVHTVASYVCCNESTYLAKAALTSAPPQGQPPAQQQPPASSGGGQPAPQPEPQPQPAPQQAGSRAAPSDFVLTAKAPKVSAKKARKAKSIAVAVTTSRPIQKLTATLKKGKKTIGTGTLTAFKGKGTLKVKVPRTLKKGSYQLLIAGSDNGVTVARTLKLTIRK
jgi:hypothetical protein